MSDAFSRRNFFQIAGAVGALGLLGKPLHASAQDRSDTSDKSIYDIIKRDHKEFKEIISRILKTQDTAKREQEFNQLRTKLLPHAKAEEAVVYPALQNSDHIMMLKGIEEHKLAEIELNELTQVPINDPRWEAKMKVLKDLVEHHAEEEEDDFFDKLKKIVKSDQAKEMGRTFNAKKQEIAGSLK